MVELGSAAAKRMERLGLEMGQKCDKLQGRLYLFPGGCHESIYLYGYSWGTHFQVDQFEQSFVVRADEELGGEFYGQWLVVCAGTVQSLSQRMKNDHYSPTHL